MSCFSKVELGSPVEVFPFTEQQLIDDPFEKKVNLGIRAFRTDEGEPWVLPVVKKVEKMIINDESLNKEYLPVLGIESFSDVAMKIVLGENCPAIHQNRAFGVQIMSGTGALRVGAEFLTGVLGKTVCYYSNPTWENHKLIFRLGGFTDRREYRYWNKKTRSLDLDGLLEDLRDAPEGAVIILHACAHNPTGCNPTEDQWKQIAEVIKEKKLFPYFDSAYQGFATGDFDKDAWAVRYFVEQGFELFCAQSFAKNFGLYNERVGNLTVVVNTPDLVTNIKSQLAILVRGMYSNPPSHGVRIISRIFNDPELFKEWLANVRVMSSRIMEMRRKLREALEKLGTPGDWSHLTTQIGMFSYTGLNEIQSEIMVKKHHVYMLSSGRISVAGLTSSNVEYVAKAIHETVTAPRVAVPA